MSRTPRTHRAVDPRWSGRPLELAEGRARVALATVPEMAADETGLVHGGFLFALADHAAMLAVDEPTVVLAAAEVRLLAPVAVGEELVAEAVVEEGGRRPRVACRVLRGEETVMEGTFHCAVPREHVLARRTREASEAGEPAPGGTAP